MEGLCVLLVVLLEALVSSQDLSDGSLIEMTVRPGENITLYCDCPSSVGVYIVWYRNCSHENQPSLVLKTAPERKNQDQSSNDGAAYRKLLNPFPDFHLVKNYSSQSYDLLITNITESDEGIYYCGTEKLKIEDKKQISPGLVRTYGNITTRILFYSSEPHHHENQPDRGLCWMLFYSVCPAFAIISSLFFSLLTYCCQKTAKESQADEKRYGKRDQTRRNQDEEVCYAALEILQAPQRAKKRIDQSSDFSSYSSCIYSATHTVRE